MINKNFNNIFNKKYNQNNNNLINIKKDNKECLLKVVE